MCILANVHPWMAPSCLPVGSPVETAAGAVALPVGSAAKAVARTPTNANANNMALACCGGDEGACARVGEGGKGGLEVARGGEVYIVLTPPTPLDSGPLYCRCSAPWRGRPGSSSICPIRSVTLSVPPPIVNRQSSTFPLMPHQFSPAQPLHPLNKSNPILYLYFRKWLFETIFSRPDLFHTLSFTVPTPL